MKPIAFVFPGQGSQSVGMLDAWGEHPAVRQTLAEASAALGEDLGALIATGPKEALALTTNTQPVMLVAGVACWPPICTPTVGTSAFCACPAMSPVGRCWAIRC